MTHYEVRTYGWTLMICFCFLIVEYSLQLASGLSGGGPGYLEILDQGGAWRRICWDSWSQGNAMVACRQLGYQQLVNTSYGEYKAVIIIFSLSEHIHVCRDRSSAYFECCCYSIYWLYWRRIPSSKLLIISISAKKHVYIWADCHTNLCW